MTVGALAEQGNKVVRGFAFTAVAARGQRAAPVRLCIGGKFAGVAVEPDAAWPNMWRVRIGKRRSDMVNLTRARDAAVVWARSRGLGGREVATWHRRETAPEGSPVRVVVPTFTDLRPNRFRPLSGAEAV
jgi:hypothetical protein